MLRLDLIYVYLYLNHAVCLMAGKLTVTRFVYSSALLPLCWYFVILLLRGYFVRAHGYSARKNTICMYTTLYVLLQVLYNNKKIIWSTPTAAHHHQRDVLYTCTMAIVRFQWSGMSSTRNRIVQNTCTAAAGNLAITLRIEIGRYAVRYASSR